MAVKVLLNDRLAASSASILRLVVICNLIIISSGVVVGVSRVLSFRSTGEVPIAIVGVTTLVIRTATIVAVISVVASILFSRAVAIVVNGIFASRLEGGRAFSLPFTFALPLRVALASPIISFGREIYLFFFLLVAPNRPEPIIATNS